jgi:hypothetical protein
VLSSVLRGRLRVRCPEEILNAVPEQELVGEHLLFAVQNRLARYKPEGVLGIAGNGLKSGR